MAHWIYGKNALLEWMEAGLTVTEIYFARDSRPKALAPVTTLAGRLKIRAMPVPRMQLTEMVGHDQHQGVAAKVQMPPYADLDDLFAKAEAAGEPPLFAILDGVQDPHNLGAIIRSADGAGVHGIIIPKDHAAGYTPVVIKASAGAAAHVPVAQVTNLARALAELKDRGLWLTGTDQEGTSAYNAIDYKGATGIVMGSEGHGMRRLVREGCDYLVSIPMHGKVNSLNVSVASALLFFEARRQRS